MAPGGVVAHSSPPAGVVAHSTPHAGVAAHWSPFEPSPQLFPFFRDAIFVSALPVVEMGSQSVLRDGFFRTSPAHQDGWTRVQRGVVLNILFDHLLPSKSGSSVQV